MTVQSVVGRLTSSFCLLSSSGIAALMVSVDPKVRKISTGVIGIWFLLCVINMLLPKEEENSLIEQVETTTSSIGSFLTGTSSSILSSSSSSGSL